MQPHLQLGHVASVMRRTPASRLSSGLTTALAAARALPRQMAFDIPIRQTTHVATEDQCLKSPGHGDIDLAFGGLDRALAAPLREPIAIAVRW